VDQGVLQETANAGPVQDSAKAKAKVAAPDLATARIKSLDAMRRPLFRRLR